MKVTFPRVEGLSQCKSWMTMGRFGPDGEWPIVIENMTAGDFNCLADIRFLIQRKAPNHLLKPGREFDIFLGHKAKYQNAMVYDQMAEVASEFDLTQEVA